MGDDERKSTLMLFTLEPVNKTTNRPNKLSCSNREKKETEEEGICTYDSQVTLKKGCLLQYKEIDLFFVNFYLSVSFNRPVIPSGSFHGKIFHLEWVVVGCINGVARSIRFSMRKYSAFKEKTWS